MTRRYGAPALDKGLDILEYLASESVSCSQQEIARALGRTSSEIFRMLLCLEERRYVMREEGTGKFRLTLRLFELSHSQNATALLRKAAALPMETLAEEVGQACHLSVVNGPTLLVLMERMPSCRVCLAVGEGSRLPLLQTSSGKLLIANWPRQDEEGFLSRFEAFRNEPEGKRRSFMKSIAYLRGAAHLHAPSGFDEGVADIVVPIGIPGSEVSGALVISYMSGTASGERNFDSCLRGLLKTAAEINRNLGIS